MAVTLRKLLESVEEERIQILAGKNNLDRAVRWTHMVESNRNFYISGRTGNCIYHRGGIKIRGRFF